MDHRDPQNKQYGPFSGSKKSAKNIPEKESVDEVTELQNKIKKNKNKQITLHIFFYCLLIETIPSVFRYLQSLHLPL
jgi:hypothetical protein